MTESGINSFDEFLLLYLWVGFAVALFWAVLEADVVLAPFADCPRRRARRLRLTRLLAPLGVMHVAFALVALDASRRPSDESPSPDGVGRFRRAAIEARVFLVLGVLVMFIVAAPHLPVAQDVPVLRTLAEASPWE